MTDKDLTDKDFAVFMLGFLIGAIVITIVIGFSFHWDNPIAPQTLKDICKNLTNNTATDYKITIDGKLHCEIPTYDHTSNIIIEKNNGANP